MGKSFKSVITVFRGYSDVRRVHTVSEGGGKGGVEWAAEKIQTSHKHLLRHGYGSRYVCAYAACFFHFIPFIFCQSAAKFVPEFRLVLLSGCSCSFCPHNICTNSNKNSKSVSKKNKRLNL